MDSENPTELKRENERLKQQLQEADARITEAAALAKEAAAHRAALEEQFARTITEKDTLVETLRHQIKLLLLKVRGSRQESIGPDQLMLFSIDELKELADELRAEADDEALEENESSGGKKHKRRGHGRRDLSDVEPTRLIHHELPDEERRCQCCGETCSEFAVEGSKQIEIIPARIEVIQHDRVKYACRACGENVVVAARCAIGCTLMRFMSGRPSFGRNTPGVRCLPWPVRRPITI